CGNQLGRKSIADASRDLLMNRLRLCHIWLDGERCRPARCNALAFRLGHRQSPGRRAGRDKTDHDKHDNQFRYHVDMHSVLPTFALLERKRVQSLLGGLLRHNHTRPPPRMTPLTTGLRSLTKPITQARFSFLLSRCGGIASPPRGALSKSL